VWLGTSSYDMTLANSVMNLKFLHLDQHRKFWLVNRESATRRAIIIIVFKPSVYSND
jgi:hypothetical protein